MSDPVGQSIGPYRVVREVGRGGMGVVYVAEDPRLDRQVAIKALPAELAADPGRLERFEREARTLASLNHPNVAGIYGVEEQGGQRYLVLEYVEGETLADRLDRGPLAVEEAVEVAVGIARGLEAAHEAGVVHRDLKPANIKITPEGRVKVLDFGLAKADEGLSSSGSGLSQSPTLTSPVPQHSPTIPGAILGTAAYMSPEQARGRRVDKRTDIWSFGVILYEMLTGTGPFVGETATDSIGAVLHKDVDPARLPIDVPVGVKRAIVRCLERDRERRYRDIGDVRLELESREREAEIVPARRGGWVALAAVLGWVAAAAVGVAALLSGLPGGGGAERSAEVVRSSVMAPEGFTIDSFDISADGRQIAMVVDPAEIESIQGPRRSLLYVRDLDAEEATLVEGSDGVMRMAYSPDGRTIVFLTRGAESSSEARVMRLPRDLSADPVDVMRVPEGVEGGGTGMRFCWTPDGDIAFVLRDANELVTFDPGTGRESGRVSIRSDVEGMGAIDLLTPFGEGAVAAWIDRYTADGFVMDAVVIDLDTGELSVVVENALGLQRVSADRVLFARSDTVFVSPFDAASKSLVGSFRSVQRGLATGAHWGHGLFRVSGNGTLVYSEGGVQGRARRLVFIDRDGIAEEWFDEERPFEDDAVVSLDGTRLATVISNPGGLYELWVSETDRPRLRRLHREPGGDVGSPVFTPDGEWIVGMCWNTTNAEYGRLTAFRFDGTDPPREIWSGWPNTEWVVPVSVSFDGERLLAIQYSGGKARLIEMPMDGSAEPRELGAFDGLFTARYAPSDDPLICYISTETGRAEAFVRTVEDGVLGPAIPVTTRGAWSSNWMYDETEGLSVLHFDLGWREHKTPVRFANGRIEIGETKATGTVGNVRYEDRSVTRDGRYLTIQSSEDERPATHLELVQGWLGSIGE